MENLPAGIEERLQSRYITFEHIEPILNSFAAPFFVSSPGMSELNLPIPMIKFGRGKKKVLIWSQMHGNESTTTKAVFDFLKYLNENLSDAAVEALFSNYEFFILPILNPDGAKAYTRVNANGVDLNRDAFQKTQKETRLLHRIFLEINPMLCLNMHDQRSIFGLSTGKPATVSFLAPAANSELDITPARETAMKLVAKMAKTLETHLPGQIGRFDDSFNINCAGDYFQNKGVPTILFEAGHYGEDYHREITRKLITQALLVLFDLIPAPSELSIAHYFELPENQKNYRDLILRNMRTEEKESVFDLAIQYKEVLEQGRVQLKAEVDEIGVLSHLKGHQEIDLKGSVIEIILNKTLTKGAEIDNLTSKNHFFQNSFVNRVL